MSEKAVPAAGSVVAGLIEAKNLWRAFQSGAEADRAHDLSIGLSASFTIDGLTSMLGAPLVEAGLRPQIHLGQYNQIFQACLDHRSQFPEASLDCLAIIWRIEDVLGPELWDFTTHVAGALDRAREKLDRLAAALARLRADFGGTIIVSLPPFPVGAAFDLLDLDNPFNAGRFHRLVMDYAQERFGQVDQVRFLDLDALQRSFGAQASFDPRKWHLYKQPYVDGFLLHLGRLLARMILANRRVPKKCLVLDADNTLWGGVIGEEGMDGIAIGEDFPGSAYRDLQKYASYMRSKGVLLAVASKNNERDVHEVFDRHDGMKLKRDHISSWRVNWRAKADNVREIARDLNIGIDSLVFVDDNLFEIEQMRAAIPEIECILVDEEPARMVEAIKRCLLFDNFELTVEDTKRADMMRAERTREDLGAALSPREFVEQLGLVVSLGVARSSHIGRVAQLTQKTNQFNLTTIRRTPEEVQSLAASTDWRVLTLDVSDKFGEYGLTGVALVETGDSHAWRLDTFLLSCRVLGRSVETAFLIGIGEMARAAGASFVDARFISTAKNALAANFLSDHGFVKTSETDWRMASADIPKSPDYLKLIFSDVPSPQRV